MNCRVRTACAAIGVLLISMMMLSLSWQWLLVGYAACSIVWTMVEFSRIRSASRLKKVGTVRPFTRTRSERKPVIYDFPAFADGLQSGTQGS